MSNKDVVLDTLCFEGSQIFLKDFHAERTFEALTLKNPSLSKSEVQQTYDRIEKEAFSEVHANKIVRLLFGPERPLEPTIEIVDKSYFPMKSKLQIFSAPMKKTGRGPQTYKWQDRSFWNEIEAQKNPEADDIILLNEKKQITETSRCNLFFYDAKLEIVLTPTLDSGCINGVYRRFVMASKKIELPQIGSVQICEKDLLQSDLIGLFIYTANSIRGVVPAEIY